MKVHKQLKTNPISKNDTQDLFQGFYKKTFKERLDMVYYLTLLQT